MSRRRTLARAAKPTMGPYGQATLYVVHNAFVGKGRAVKNTGMEREKAYAKEKWLNKVWQST